MRYLGVLAAGLVAFAIASQADVVTVEQIVCKLNGDIITNLDLDHDRADLEKQLRANGYTGKRLEDAIKAEAPNLLRNKIDNLLLVQKGKELELKVDPDVNKYLADLQRQTNTADPEKFQALVRQETGKSYEDFKADLKNNFYVQGVIREEVMRKIQFTTEEVRAYYDAHKDEFQREERVFLREIAISTQGKERSRGPGGRREESQGSGGPGPQRRTLQRAGANQLGFPDGERRRRAGSLQERRPGARDRSRGLG